MGLGLIRKRIFPIPDLRPGIGIEVGGNTSHAFSACDPQPQSRSANLPTLQKFVIFFIYQMSKRQLEQLFEKEFKKYREHTRESQEKKQKQETINKQKFSFHELPSAAQEKVKDFLWGFEYQGPPKSRSTVVNPIYPYKKERNPEKALDERMEYQERKHNPFALRAITPNLAKQRMWAARNLIRADEEWYNKYSDPKYAKISPMNHYTALETLAIAFNKPRPRKPMIYEE